MISTFSFSQVHTPTHKPRGFTLIECLTSLAILAILIVMAAPKLEAIITKQRLDADTQLMLRMLAKARETAIITQQPTLLCGLNQHNACDAKNIKRMAVFSDQNKNFMLDENEMVISQLASTPHQIWLMNQNRFHYFADGSLHPAVSIFICDAQLTLAQRISTNMAGRSYVARTNRAAQPTPSLDALIYCKKNLDT